jgi:predicted  nucleic acid-binding Zn-ribbon protein
MPALSRRQLLAKKQLNSSGSNNGKNIPPDPSPITIDDVPEPSKKSPQSLKVQILERDSLISLLETRVSALEAEVLELRNSGDQATKSLSRRTETLVERNRDLSLTNSSLKSLKRKAETALTQELAKRQKRIKRLERECSSVNNGSIASISGLKEELEQKSAHITQLERDLDSAHTHILSRDSTITSLKVDLRDKQVSITATRKRLYASQKQVQRAQSSLKELRADYKQLHVWNPMSRGQYSSEARKLARDLTLAGCAAGKVVFAVKSCAEAFGIKIRRRFMSRRTVSRAVDEGGKYGEIQLAREILNAPGMQNPT